MPPAPPGKRAGFLATPEDPAGVGGAIKEVRRLDFDERCGPMLEMRRRAAALRRGVPSMPVADGAHEEEEEVEGTMGA